MLGTKILRKGKTKKFHTKTNLYFCGNDYDLERRCSSQHHDESDKNFPNLTMKNISFVRFHLSTFRTHKKLEHDPICSSVDGVLFF